MNFYDCKGGPGTTEPACGACVTCLHRVIEAKDAHIKQLEEVVEEVVEESDIYERRKIWRKAKKAKP